MRLQQALGVLEGADGFHHSRHLQYRLDIRPLEPALGDIGNDHLLRRLRGRQQAVALAAQRRIIGEADQAYGTDDAFVGRRSCRLGRC